MTPDELIAKARDTWVKPNEITRQMRGNFIYPAPPAVVAALLSAVYDFAETHRCCNGEGLFNHASTCTTMQALAAIEEALG
jgi:hypothetical protein